MDSGALKHSVEDDFDPDGMAIALNLSMNYEVLALHPILLGQCLVYCHPVMDNTQGIQLRSCITCNPMSTSAGFRSGHSQRCRVSSYLCTGRRVGGDA